MELHLVLDNATFTLGRKKVPFYQEFEVNFYWMNYTLNYSAIRSGNPGYKTEKPVLVGTLFALLNVTNITGTNLTETKTYYKIYRNPVDVTQNFLVFPGNQNGYCTSNNVTHASVEFGYNSIFKCRFVDRINITESPNVTCKTIQKYILDRWYVIYENSSNTTRVVGRFGNANPNHMGEWLKILHNKLPSSVINSTTGRFLQSNQTIRCGKIVSRLGITIFHSRVDTKHYSDQEKIVGVLFKFGSGEDFDFAIEKGRTTFDVPAHVEVVFVDTTRRKVKKFADPPTFKIRLPYDFFYPFVKVPSGSGRLSFPLTFFNFFVLKVCAWSFIRL